MILKKKLKELGILYYEFVQPREEDEEHLRLWNELNSKRGQIIIFDQLNKLSVGRNLRGVSELDTFTRIKTSTTYCTDDWHSGDPYLKINYELLDGKAFAIINQYS